MLWAAAWLGKLLSVRGLPFDTGRRKIMKSGMKRLTLRKRCAALSKRQMVMAKQGG